jgi:hypothetical protein
MKNISNYPVFEKWNFEETDTFGGEANYAWVNRVSIQMPVGSDKNAIKKAVDKEFGYEGGIFSINEIGEGFEIVPTGACVIVFATPDMDYEASQNHSFLDFWRGFIDCLIWQATDDEGTSLDDLGADVSMIDTGDLKSIWGECYSFFQQTEHLITDDNYASRLPSDVDSVFEIAGHDYCLTRNGHGAGFWDGDWSNDIGEILSAFANEHPAIYVDYEGEGSPIHVGSY